jgi:hypothetical protein
MRPNNVTTLNWLQYNVLFFIYHFLGENWYQKLFGKAENKLYKKIEEHATAHPADDGFKILEYTKGNYPEPHCHPYSPIIFRGLANDWKATKKWSFDFFAEKYGDQDVTIINNKGGVLDPEEPAQTLKFRDYIANLKNGTKKYLKFSRIVDEDSNLRADFDYDWLRKFRTRFAREDLFYFFMGGKNTLTPIHNGYAITVYVHVVGTKRWIFYPVNQRLFIGVRPRRQGYYYTDANPHNLNDAKFPLLKLSQPHEVILNAGDVLYFPSMVWHQVENVTDTIGVAYKFADLGLGFVSSKMLASCFFLSTDPWFIETLLPWKADMYNYKKKK